MKHFMLQRSLDIGKLSEDGQQSKLIPIKLKK